MKGKGREGVVWEGRMTREGKGEMKGTDGRNEREGKGRKGKERIGVEGRCIGQIGR